MMREPAMEKIEITQEAFLQVDAWTERFARGLHETAIRLVNNSEAPGLITRDILSAAVRITCAEMSSEADSAGEDWSSDGNVRDAA